VRRSTVVLLALAVISAAIAGYILLRPSPPNESERYRDAVTVMGHQRVISAYSRMAYAIFVGEELSDSEVAVSVSAPQTRWITLRTLSDGDLSLVTEGYGVMDDIRCFVKVQRIRPDAAVRLIGAGHLTAVQAAGLADGSLEAIKVAVLCDPQDDI
jgi:hypothetical protein